MKKYEYNFIKVPVKPGFKAHSDDAFNACKEIIIQEAAKGWRLKQILAPFNEKTGVYRADSYEIIFEKEV